MSSKTKENYDFVVIGSGLAGLSFALKAAKLGRVLVLSKGELIQANTWRAQGGVASVTAETDSFEDHIKDTLVAGDGLCEIESVKNIIEQGPILIKELIKMGVQFDGSEALLDLGQEGGHSQRRILHIDDFTGQALHQKFIDRARQEDQITLLEHVFATRLIVRSGQCLGVEAFDLDTFYEIVCKNTVIATGGAGKAFLYTSNWSGATGDGIALAYKAGAKTSNMEFTQFHPTCLYHPAARNFLISEALRGEGAVLINSKNEAFMKKYHPSADLAPRDIVARSIDKEMKSAGSECVWLDLSRLQSSKLAERFPKIYKKCLEFGIDFLKDPIPVVPAAHYTCGGITVDEFSQTSFTNLYALGECAETGLHGANRLASNSLLECLATANNAYEKIKASISSEKPAKPLLKTTSKNIGNPLDESKFFITTLWEEVRRIMWLRMGIMRSSALMSGALKKMLLIEAEINDLRNKDKDILSFQPFLELENITVVAKLMIEAALNRNESRGCHYNSDYPGKGAVAKKSICQLGHSVEYLIIGDDHEKH